MMAPKFGLAAVPHSVRRNRSNPSPAPAMPQPLACVIGTMPWTLSKPSSSPVFSAASAMCRATVAEQFTLVRTPI